MSDLTIDPKQLIKNDFNQFEATALESVIVGGSGNFCRHHHSILIGVNLESDRDYQLKIGSGENAVSIDIVPEQYGIIREGLLAAYPNRWR